MTLRNLGHANAKTMAFHVRHRNGWGTGCGPSPTHCADCGEALPPRSGMAGTGYGCQPGEPISADDYKLLTGDVPPALRKGAYLEVARVSCYACCGERDMEAMRATGRAVLYLTEARGVARVGNWPGSWSVAPSRVRYKARSGGFGAQRTDVWFVGPDGATWHGINRGDNQLLRCRRLRGKA